MLRHELRLMGSPQMVLRLYGGDVHGSELARRVGGAGKLLREDGVTSNYVAVGPTQIYGPGRSIPGPYFVLPRV